MVGWWHGGVVGDGVRSERGGESSGAYRAVRARLKLTLKPRAPPAPKFFYGVGGWTLRLIIDMVAALAVGRERPRPERVGCDDRGGDRSGAIDDGGLVSEWAAGDKAVSTRGAGGRLVPAPVGWPPLSEFPVMDGGAHLLLCGGLFVLECLVLGRRHAIRH